MRWRPALHGPSIRGRARADLGPLILVAIVVATVSLLAAAVPPLIRSTADAATREAVRRDPEKSAVRVEARFDDDYGPNGGRVRYPRLADEVNDFLGRAQDALDPALKAALEPPVTTVTTPTLAITDGSVQRHFQVDYLQSNGHDPAVTWLAGGPPKATTDTPYFLEIPLNGSKWQVQVGISEAAAAALKIRPGQTIPLEDDLLTKYNVKVSGIFRAADRNDPAWRALPWLLQPVAGVDGQGSTRFGGLTSAASFPDARMAFLPDQMQRTIWFSADPDRLTWKSAQQLATTVARLKATSGASGSRDSSLKWATQLDVVLRAVRDQVTAATAQATVLLIGVLVTAGFVLMLTADLLARRRSPALIAARQRGQSLPDLATELIIESVTTAVPAAALGCLIAWVAAGGAALKWVLPVAGCAIVAGPAFGTIAAARATRDRRAPANRSARRWQRRTAQLRRLCAEAAVLAAATAAVVALHQRGVSGGGDNALPAAAPTLGVVAGTLLLLRLLPASTLALLGPALRSRRTLAVFSLGRAAATATRVLPLLVLSTATALAAFALTLDATTERGLADGAWHTVGADARFDVGPDALASTPDIARRIAAAPGVTQVATAQIIDGVRIFADDTSMTPSLVLLDSAEYRRLLAATPLPEAPDLARLPATGDALPALVLTGDGSLRPGMRLRLLRENQPALPLSAVGASPAIDNTPDVVVVDAARAKAAGLEYVPNTVWATGPGAATAVKAVTTSGHPVVRADVLHDRRTSSLTAGLVSLDRAAAVALMALGLLGFALGAATGAPERWTTLARLRTLGLRPKDARRVAVGELLPPVLTAAVFGPLLALLVVRLTFGPLALRVLTSQTADPAPTTSWIVLGAALIVLLAMPAVVVTAESSTRRRRGLGETLRLGD